MKMIPLLISILVASLLTSILVSALLLRIEIENIEYSLRDSCIVVEALVRVENLGLYPISNVVLKYSILSETGESILQGTTSIGDFKPMSSEVRNVKIILDLKKVLAPERLKYLIESTNAVVHLNITSTYAWFMKVRVETEFPYKWRALVESISVHPLLEDLYVGVEDGKILLCIPVRVVSRTLFTLRNIPVDVVIRGSDFTISRRLYIDLVEEGYFTWLNLTLPIDYFKRIVVEGDLISYELKLVDRTVFRGTLELSPLMDFKIGRPSIRTLNETLVAVEIPYTITWRAPIGVEVEVSIDGLVEEYTLSPYSVLSEVFVLGVPTRSITGVRDILVRIKLVEPISMSIERIVRL
ncbi:MAG: hypothetical protein DRN53_04800 [Thermoprotei archaeon]|nr:MAG: hypothetical protein DRN53_04800 [Thermoprotei archaeon]